MEKRVVIIGAGSFGTALAQVFTDKGMGVMLYTNKEEQASEINKEHTNKYYFPNLVFSPLVRATTSIRVALAFAEIVIIAVPSKAVRGIAKLINEEVDGSKLFVNVAKGLEPHTHQFGAEILAAEIDKGKRRGIVVLTGPSHAEEIEQRLFTALVAVSEDINQSEYVQRLFSNDYIRVYTGTDLIGAQLGGAVKNILAIASGIIAGLGYGDNTRAALITRGLKEMVAYGVSKGAAPYTFYGLAGIGDLVVTATSTKSRNYQIGYKVGLGMEPKAALASMKTVVEGVRTTAAVYEDAKVRQIEMPITECVYKIFFEGAEVRPLIEAIKKRKLKAE